MIGIREQKRNEHSRAAFIILHKGYGWRAPPHQSLCGAIGQRVRLLTERLVVRAHPGTLSRFTGGPRQFCTNHGVEASGQRRRGFRGSGEEKPRVSLRGPAGVGSPASGRAGAPPPTPAARWALPAAPNRRVGPAPEGPRILSFPLPGFLNSGPLPPRSFPKPPPHSSQPRLAGLPRAPVGQRRPERAEAGRPPRSGLEPAAPAPGAARAGLVLLQDPCDVRGRLNVCIQCQVQAVH